MPSFPNLRNLQLRPLGLHLKQDKEIVPGPPASQAFAEDIHRNRQEGQEQARPSKDVHDLFRTVGCDPVVGEIAEAVEHEILKFKTCQPPAVDILCRKLDLESSCSP